MGWKFDSKFHKVSSHFVDVFFGTDTEINSVVNVLFPISGFDITGE